ncbi:MAG: HAMP domain-containing sensor histidine kinase, partial [Bacilli bacterium]
AYAVEDMRVSLKNQEEYRNQMYQNISHDFKTPLTVIKSYIEAVDDKVEDPCSALAIIKEETYSLENKVHSLLYLNKLDYLKEAKQVDIVLVDIIKILDASLEKFKFQRKDIVFTVSTNKTAKFYGTYDLFETIINNLLGNFMRYADKVIKITVSKNKITLYNDGPNIEDNFLNGIFTPFRKGIKGEFGLGLSIVKKSANLIGYDVVIKNHNKKGVSFIICKK